MKLLACLLMFLAGCSGCASVPDYASAKQAAVRLQWPHSHTCSGTAVGAHTILSAAHCFMDESGMVPVKSGWMLVDDVRADYTVIADDGNDHVLVRVSTRQAHVAIVGPKPKQGDVVFTNGNPGGYKDLLIVGYVSGWVDGNMEIDSNSWHGDSGAGMLDSQGRIVGVVSGPFPWPPACDSAYCWRLTELRAMKFSAEDWKAARA